MERCVKEGGCYAPAACQRERNVSGNSSRCMFADRLEFAAAYPSTPAARAFYALYPNTEGKQCASEADVAATSG